MTQRKYDLILASQSPRRRQLLERYDYQFTVQAPDESVEEEVARDELKKKSSPEEFVAASAKAKARVIAQGTDDGLVLAADTVAECDGQILGKPTDRDHAEQMLRLMSGRSHRVLTGVCLWQQPSNQSLVVVEQTELRMDVLSESQLKEMLNSNGWVGKAGAFGYQDGLDWLHVESGLESNVVGLPVEKIDTWIDQLFQQIESSSG